MEMSLLRFRQGLACPRCGGHWVVLYGKRKDVQKYRCNECGRYFNDRTGTPMAYTKLPDKWPQMAKALQQSLTIRETAAYLDVCRDTAFRWRHRMLDGVQAAHRGDKLSGIVEIGKTVFRYSEKGSRRLERKLRKRGARNPPHGSGKGRVYAVAARDRANRTRSFLLVRMSGKALSAAAGDAIAKGSVLCSERSRSYKTFAIISGLRHLGLNIRQGKLKVHGIYHLQSVSSYQARLKDWLRRFKGVATKYLPNYLVWYEHLDDARQLRRGLGEQKLFISAVSAARSITAA